MHRNAHSVVVSVFKERAIAIECFALAFSLLNQRLFHRLLKLVKRVLGLQPC